MSLFYPNDKQVNRPMIVFLLLNLICCLNFNGCSIHPKNLSTSVIEDSYPLDIDTYPPVKGVIVEASIRCNSTSCPSIKGELLHINTQHLYIHPLKESCPVQIEIINLVELKLNNYYFNVERNLGVPLIITMLGTLSHGLLMILSLPFTSLVGGLGMYCCHNTGKTGMIEEFEHAIEKLSYFSRFPGLFPIETYQECKYRGNWN